MGEFEDITTKYGKQFEKVASLVVDRYTFVDENNMINVCELDTTNLKCHRTSLRVTLEYLEDDLRNNYRLIGSKSSLLHNSLLNVLEEIFDFDSDTSLIILYHFIFPKIYKKYYEPLSENDIITENVEDKPKFKLTKSQINSLLSNYEYMGYDEEYAKEDLIDLVSYLNKLPSTLKLYRIICADDINEIDRVNVGSHYSPNKNNLVRDHYEGGSIHSHCFGVKVFLLTVEVDKTKMDVLQTLSNNILYPHEEEITLKNKGKGAQIINIEEL